MDCSCSINVCYDGDGSEFSRNEIRTAKKEHKCCECKRTIIPGEKYEYTVGKWGGLIGVYKTCNDCLSVRKELFPYDFIFSEMWYYIKEDINNGTEFNSSCLANLTTNARNKICDLMEEYWDEE